MPSDQHIVRGVSPTLWQAAKVRAAQEGRTIGQVVTAALAAYLGLDKAEQKD